MSHYPPPPSQPQYGQAAPHPQYNPSAPPPQQFMQGSPPPPPPQQQQQYNQALPPQNSPAPQAATQGSGNEDGQFDGGSYTISHRHTNSILTVRLQGGAAIRSKTGAMIHMGPQVALEGKVKFSMRKMLTGGDLAESTYGGQGPVTLGPTLFGDINTIRIGGGEQWMIGKDAFLACTSGVARETKSQGFGKALFSGEDLFIYHIQGQGLLWVSSYGAIDRIQLRPGEEHIVDNGHLVAWSCNYRIEKVGGSSMTGLKTGEGLVCRFTGPGTILIQTRNLADFSSWVASQVPSRG